MLVCLVVGVKFENAVECSMVLNNLWHSLANLLLCLLQFFFWGGMQEIAYIKIKKVFTMFL